MPPNPKPKPKAPVDPLSRFRAGKPRRGRRGSRPFEGGEHAWLGDAGAALAARELRAEGLAIDDEVFATIGRLHTDDVFQYGELVALGGDLYGSPSELYEERPAAVPWLWEDDDLDDVKQLFAAELKWVEDRQRGRGAAAYPDHNVRLAWNAKSYLELALKNVDHFGWHNLVTYCRHHGAALALAAASSGKGERWARALVYNAFADHFLTDGFAAGHLRVPRAEICAFAQAQGWDDKLAGALSKLLHDQDGHVDTLHGACDSPSPDDGLPVKSSRGDAWRTYCDGQLFLFPGAATQPHVKHPVRAVADSVKELVRAAFETKVPRAVFEAAKSVPFPDPAAPGLAEKFRALGGAKLAELMASVQWYSKVPWLGPGLQVGHVEALLEALPQLMKTFNAEVKAERARDRTLEVRLPQPYLDAYASLT